MMGRFSSVGILTRRGSKEASVVRRDSDGTVGGVQIEHWDGRVDAKVVPLSVQLKVLKEGN
jgi:hypothetical protein